MKGCECGNRLFAYLRPLSEAEADRLKEEGAREVGEFDIWNIRVKDGVYDIDLESLLQQEPIIVAGEEGRYLLSLSSVFRDRKKERKLIDKFREK